MNQGRVLFVAAGLWLASGAGMAAETATPWVHVRVQESDKSTAVDVNLPLSVVEIALKAAPSKVVSNGKFHLDHHDTELRISDLKKIWRELGAAGDHELVSVRSDEETVRVARKGGKVEVRVEKLGEKDRGRGQVRVDVPVAVVDALLQGEGDEVDLAGALAQLRSLRGDIVQVLDEDTNVRVWVDENP